MSDNILNNDSGVVKPVIPDVPTINPNSPLPPFKAWVQMAIPTVYDESLSYAELLYKVINYLNVTNDHLTNNDNIINELSTYMGEEVTIIQNWFNNLVVDNEVDRKVQEVLDLWASNGRLVTLLSPTIISETDTWLGDHIQPTTLSALDSTLLLENAAANSKATGDAIFGDMNTSTIRPYISSACPKTYHFFSQVYGSPLNIHNIKDMGYNTVVWVNVSSSNIDNVKDFISYVKNGVTVYPINIVVGNEYMICKYHLYDRVIGTQQLDANIYTIRNLTTNDIVHGYLYVTSANPEPIHWFKNTDTTLLDSNSGADSKTVGDTIYRELNTANVRNSVRNYGTLKYIYSSASAAISDLHNIGVDSPYDMVNGSSVSLVETTANPNMSTFLGDFMPTDGIYNNTFYTLEKRLISGSTTVFILYSATGNQIYYGIGQPDTSATPPYKITWGSDIGSRSIDAKINTLVYASRENISPLPFAVYTPTTTPFDPWEMPDNTVYFGVPSLWYENSEHVPYISLERSYFEKANSTTNPKELIGTTYQLIKYRKNLQIICPYNKQFFYGGKTVVSGTALERWATNSIENNVEYTNEYTVYNTEINRTGSVTINPDITTDTNNFLSATGTTEDVTTAIEGMLATGCCILGCGDFYVADLVMPDNTCLRGCGNKTRLIWSKPTGSTCMIQMGHNCNIENLRIDAEGQTTSPFDWGDVTPTDEKVIPNFSAILYQNHEATGIADLNQSKISNVSIFNCNGVGIKTSTSTSKVDRNLIVVNCHIRDCVCGIYNSSVDGYTSSEFHKFTNVVITHCFYGCVVQGGNIIYNNCTIGTCHIGAKLISGYNDSHGIFNACLFVHMCNNIGTDTQNRTAGYSIKADNVQNGEKFSSCNMGYGKIHITSCEGIRFNDCGISEAQIKLIDYTTGSVFNGLSIGRNVSFEQGANVVGTRIVNCYNSDGSVWNG